jgi:hypothetical protein
VVHALLSGVHVQLLDLLHADNADPNGIHAAIWENFDTTGYTLPEAKNLTVASSVWLGEEPQVYLEQVIPGQTLPDMPLFLTDQIYVNVPLETTYQRAFRGMPRVWRDVLETDLKATR